MFARSIARSVARTASSKPSSSLPSAVTRSFVSSSLLRQSPPTKTPEEIQAEYDSYRTTTAKTREGEDVIIRYDSIMREIHDDDLGHRTVNVNEKRHNKRTLQTLSFDGKVCVVTGAARGLGNMFARTFVESGCSKVVIMDLNQADADRAATELTEWFEQHGDVKKGDVEALGLGVNVADEAAVQAAFAEVKKQFGGVDVLVTAAGIVENFPAEVYPSDRMKLLYDINVHGTYYCAREAAKIMFENETKGSIVMVGSMSSNIVNIPQRQAPYNASKAAVRHLASSMAVEWATRGIRVNCLSPGYMLTALTKTILDRESELRNKWVGGTPMQRMGEPEDLKGAIVYLASDAAAFTTGVNLNVDGGYCLVNPTGWVIPV